LSRLFSNSSVKNGGESVLYKRIEAKCREKNISVSALEKAVGLGNATVKGWSESSPKVENLKKVADYFGCTIDELLKEE
jgi:transcriptional regulator with XRE-family HTH domain